MFEAGEGQLPLVLASASASRAGILQNAGLAFRQLPSDIDERAIEMRFSAEAGQAGGAFPERLALSLAEAKALVISREIPDALVIGADQVMACRGEILHKPETLEAAREQLASLRNDTHSLYSAICVALRASIEWRYCARADLVMRDFSDAFLNAYCFAEGETMLRSVGSYRVEGLGIHLFSEIRGDLHTIMGLPLLPLLGYLRDRGTLIR